MVSKRIAVGDRRLRFEEQEDLLKFLDDEKRKSMIDSQGYEILNFKSLVDGGTYTLGPPQQQQQQTRDVWYLVKGTVERNKSMGGVRFKLIELAVGTGGYYPQGKGIESAFQVRTHSTEDDKRTISVSVVFDDKRSANGYITSIDNYITTTRGLTIPERFKRFTTDFSEADADLVLTSDYTPCEADGEPPNDSPVWDVEVSGIEMSSKATSYGKDDTVYKYQRIETDRAFARCKADGAHIFPKAKCKENYKWLDKKDFNRLALSVEGHINFDGTAKGSAVRAETQPLVTVEPIEWDEIELDQKQFYRISTRLWCRDREVGTAWRPCLPENVVDVVSEGHIYFQGPLYIYCEKNRTQEVLFEKQQNPDGSTEDVCITVIPGVEDPSSLTSWDENTHTVGVHEIVYKLLLWNYNETRRQWKAVS